MSKKRKPIAAKRFALLSLQFWKDKDGTPSLLVTSNPEENGKNIFSSEWGVNSGVLARQLVKDNTLLGDQEKRWLVDFFEQVRAYLKEEANI